MNHPPQPSRVRRDLAIVCALVLLTTLPFAGKAAHIDDVYFLEIAENVLRDPLRPFAGAVALEDIDYRVFASAGRCPDTFASMSHPPLVPYVMALIARAAGEFREVPLHLGFDLFALGAAFAMYDLAKRFTPRPLLTTVLLVSSPIFVLGAQGLMTDMPALALSLGSLALFIRGMDQPRGRLILPSGVVAGLAVVTRYSAVGTVALMCAYSIVRGRARRAWPALLGAVLVLGLWAAQNLAVHGELHVVASARHYHLFYAGRSFDWEGLLKNALGDLGGLGGTSFAAAALLLATGLERRAMVFGLGVFSAAMVFVARPAGLERLELYSTLDVIEVATAFASGLLLVVEALWPSPPTRDSVPGGRFDSAFLVGWLALELAGSLLLLPFGTARYMLPVLPPLWLLLVRRFGRREWSGRRRLGASLVVSQALALSLVMAVADADLADDYRALAVSLRETYPRRTLWYVGEWGFRFYMDREGGRYLTSSNDRPQPGDLIVRPAIAGMHEMSPALAQRTVLLRDIRLDDRWPIRLMSFHAKAGYYSHHWGYLPWAISRAPVEDVRIFEVRSPAPPTPPDTCASS
jgi:Dolichyl-phosphate-mannose-protein mannosyltransferase